MPNYLKPFLLGVVCTLLIVAGSQYLRDGKSLNIPNPFTGSRPAPVEPSAPLAPSEAVKIQQLPSLRVLSGVKVGFDGKVQFPQVIAGRYAKDLIVTHFSATGENAGKSTIRIVWEDGSTDIIPAGTYDRIFPSERRAKQIIVSGYSMYERKIFRDSARPGTLTWEIKYLPVEE